MRPHGRACRVIGRRCLSHGLQVDLGQQGRARRNGVGSRRQLGQTGPAALEKGTMAFATVMIAGQMVVSRARVIAVAVCRVLVLLTLLGQQRDGGTAIVRVLMVRATTDAHMRCQQDSGDDRDEFAIQHKPSFTRVPFKYRPCAARGQDKLCGLAELLKVFGKLNRRERWWHGPVKRRRSCPQSR
jgi:hypothetical protein